MAKKSMILKQQAEPKFSSRRYNRCKLCGRPHAYLRNYGICRICFRELAYKGQIPGVKKASWYVLFIPGRDLFRSLPGIIFPRVRVCEAEKALLFSFLWGIINRFCAEGHEEHLSTLP